MSKNKSKNKNVAAAAETAVDTTAAVETVETATVAAAPEGADTTVIVEATPAAPEGLPAFTIKDDCIEATAKALIENGLTINDTVASLNDISAYARTKLFPVIGVAHKEAGVRGPKGSVLRVPLDGSFAIALRR